jgi:class 3 adenylate cyclase
MESRIGVNLGDVIADGEQIRSDGVNVAASIFDMRGKSKRGCRP